MTGTRICRNCGEELTLDDTNFGHTPSGGFRHKCRACMRRHVRSYDLANVEGARERARLRQQREAAHPKLSAKEKIYFRYICWGIQKGECFFCKNTVPCEDGHLDHLTPVARGGNSELDNFCFACDRCNQEKHAKTVEEYRTWLVARGYPAPF